MNIDNNIYMNTIAESANYIKEKLGNFTPEILIILGSGLGDLAEQLTEKIVIPYSEIPSFPQSTVVGHKGQFVAGILNGRPVICMQGRFHYYEGYDLRTVTLPIRVIKSLGVNSLIVTNAAGGVNRGYKPGELMIISDHINLTGANPLIGHNLDKLGIRFVDMSRAYDREYILLAEKVATNMNFDIKKGVYAWLTGPTYETPAEIRFAEKIGADAVGMSTVPEVIVARHMGMRVLGISCITNMAAGILDQLLDHSEVTETANMVKSKFMELVSKIAKELPSRYNTSSAVGLNNLPQCAEIREAVFVKEQGFDRNSEFDDIDSTAIHALIKDIDKAVATGRAFANEDYYKIGRICVLKEYRGQNLGEMVVTSLEKEIKVNGGKLIKLSAQITAKGFYEKLGYTAFGEEYLDEHCPHIDMKKYL